MKAEKWSTAELDWFCAQINACEPGDAQTNRSWALKIHERHIAERQEHGFPERTYAAIEYKFYVRFFACFGLSITYRH